MISSMKIVAPDFITSVGEVFEVHVWPEYFYYEVIDIKEFYRGFVQVKVSWRKNLSRRIIVDGSRSPIDGEKWNVRYLNECKRRFTPIEFSVFLMLEI